jgi:hypothetical protein
MVRRLVTSVVLALLTVAAVVPTAGAVQLTPSRTVSAAPTVIEHVRPVGPGGGLLAGYTSTHSHTGASCEAGSEATGDAYRCFAGNGVYDPCWVMSNRVFVVCMSAPWSFKAVLLHVTKGYDNTGRTSKAAKYPWGVELTNGQLCQWIQGASGTVRGRRISYVCQRVTYALVGNVDRHHKAWRIRKARRTSGGHYKLAGWVDISKAYFGKPSRKG